MAERDPHSDDPYSEDAHSEEPRSEDAVFDDIVSQLDLDWDDPGLIDSPGQDTEPVPEPEPEDSLRLPPELDVDDESDPVDEQFYRQVPQGPVRPPHKGRALAWGGVLGTPVVLALCTLFGVWLSGPLLLTAGLIFVAGAIYLISQLPERGPSHPDWPDDGAVL
ncbi:hypothetical protein [Aeromicrobium sp. CTD01-1L150]|uniref:hypothetical protein n=1 Tax=Aeromicrobium sp. CTD01-1L150 TaxID=3341830 RepID=UPI0035BEF13C